MVQVGQKYLLLPAFICSVDNRPQSRKQVGEVVEVHQKHRWARLKFEGVSGNPLEGFKFDDLTPDKLVTGERRKRK